MPTRSIKVKLFLPRGEAGQSLRQSLWATHAAINAATRFYEQQLLLMRSESYVTGDEEVEEAAVNDGVRQLVREARARNGGAGDTMDDEAVTLLRKLYERIVPSSIGEDGTAQASNAFIGPLTDPWSLGFLGVYDKLERPVPNWVSLVEAGETSAFEACLSGYELYSPLTKSSLDEVGMV